MSSAADNAPRGDVLQIGACTLVISLREVRDAQRRRPARLTPKALGVLMALAAEPGRVLSREELFARVWPDTMPGNDVLTQAITQLRKAFSGDGRDPERQAYIETIAKTGYRLLAPVQWIGDVQAGEAGDAAVTTPESGDEPAAARGAASPSASRGRARRWPARGWPVILAALAAVMLCLLVVMAAYVTRQRPVPLVQAEGHEQPYRLIVSELGFETWPSISPDGQMVAYTSELPADEGSVIKVQASDNTPPRVLSHARPGQMDRTPAWSPDGRRIAFARFHDDGRCSVIVASAEGQGDERAVAGCDGTTMLSFDWTPDGRGLVFGRMTGIHATAGMRVLDLETGTWRALKYPVDSGDFDYAPRYSPDGQWIGFIRNPQLGDLWRIPAEGGPAEQLTHMHAELRGWSWLPDGGQLVFGRRVGNQARLYRLDLDTREMRDFGLEDAQSPTVAPRSGTLAFVRRQPQFGIFRFSPGADGAATGQRLFPSLGRDAQPAPAPDGRQLLFASDRSGSYAFWWGVPGSGQPPRLIENFKPDNGQMPDWSDDSASVLALGQGSEGSGIYRITPAAGTARRLPVPMAQPLQAAHAGNTGRLLVVGREDDGRLRLVLYDSTQAPWRRLGSLDGVSQVRYDREHARVVFTRIDGPGLWESDARLSPGSIRQLDAAMPSLWRYRSWALSADGTPAYLSSDAGCATGLALLGERGRRSWCLDPERLSTVNGFGADGGNGDLYVALAVQDGTNIGVMTLPQESPVPWVGIINWLFGKEK